MQELNCKLLDENIGKNMHDLGFGKAFSDLRLKTQVTKKTMNCT